MSHQHQEQDADEDAWEHDETEPWADPTIQREYQAALGEFLVKFNRLENLVGDVLERSLTKLGRPDLYRAEAQLSAKLHHLEIVGLALPSMHKPDMTKIRQILGERNTLTHGHFDQNPYSGDYTIKSGKKISEMPLTKMRTLCDLVTAATDDVLTCTAYLWFGGIARALPPGASKIQHDP